MNKLILKYRYEKIANCIICYSSGSLQRKCPEAFYTLLLIEDMYGLEYSYEYKWDNGMALIGRVGAGGEVYSPSKNNYSLNSGFNLTRAEILS